MCVSFTLKTFSLYIFTHADVRLYMYVYVRIHTFETHSQHLQLEHFCLSVLTQIKARVRLYTIGRAIHPALWITRCYTSIRGFVPVFCRAKTKPQQKAEAPSFCI